MGLAIGSVLVFACAALFAQAPAPVRRPPAQVRSPEIGPDRRVTFRLRAPAAKEVSVSGEFMRGGKSLQKDEDGLWTVVVGPLEPEIYNYNFTVDGVRTIDPGNPEVKTGSTASTIGSVLEVRGETPAFYEVHPVPHGEIHTLWYDSKSLKYTRRLTVYTPPGYDPAARTRYPVLYLFHGANADETAWTRLGRVNLILDNLLAAGKIKPFLVVMPFGYPAPPGTGASGAGASGAGGGFSQIATLFGRDLTEDVIPLVESRYRAYTDRDHRAIAGLSMGGLESLEIGLNHIDLFSFVGGFSAAVNPAAFPQTFASLTANPQEANQKLHLLWFGCGTDDSLFAASENFDKFLTSAKVKHVFKQSEGAHTWMVWRRYLNEFAPLIF